MNDVARSPEIDREKILRGPDAVKTPEPEAKREDPAEVARLKMARYVWDRAGDAARKEGMTFEDYAKIVKDRGMAMASQGLRDVANGVQSVDEYRAGPKNAPIDLERRDQEPKPDEPEDPETSVTAGPKRTPRISATEIAKLGAEMRSYEKRLVTVMGMDAARARSVVNDDLDIGAKVTSLARQAVREAGQGAPQMPAGTGQIKGGQTPAKIVAETPEPVNAEAHVRTMTASVMRDLNKMQAPKGQMRKLEDVAHDDAPMMSAKRRHDRDDRDMDGPSF